MLSRNKLITGSILLCAVFLAGSLGAETVFLRNGRKVTGTIVGQGRTWVALRVNGRRTVIRKSRIRRISYRRSRPVPVPGADRKKAEEAKRKKAAEARRKRREARERRRRAAERRKRAAAAAKKKAEEERKRKEAAAAALAKKKAEEERKRKAAAAALAKKKAEEERKRKAAAAALAKKKAEEERKRKAAAAALAKKKAEEERKRKAAAAALAKKKAEDDKRKAAAIAAAKKKAEDDKRKAAAAADAKKKAEIAALKRKQEDDRKKAAAAAAAKKKAQNDKRKAAVAKKQEPKKSGETIPSWQAALWSAALPGLGQWFQGRKAEAVTYGSLFGIGAVAAYEANRRVLNATRDYNETSNPFSTETLIQQSAGISVIPSSTDLADPAVATLYSSNFELQKQAVDDHYATYQQFTVFAGLIYAWNIADAFLADADPNYGYAPDLSPAKAAMWSAIIPGWGQWKTNRRNTGIFYASVVAAGLVGMYEKNRNVKNAARDYDELNNPYTTSNLLSVAVGASTGETATDALGASIVDNQFRAQRDALNRHYREFQQLGYLTLAVYAWSIADAYFFTRSSPGALTESAPSPAGLRSRGFVVAPILVPGNDNEAPRAAMRFAWNFSF